MNQIWQRHWQHPADFADEFYGRSFRRSRSGSLAKRIEKLGQLALTRNQWVHDDWCINERKTLTVIFNQRAALESKERRKPVKKADVMNHCGAVATSAKELAQLIDQTSLPI